MIWATSPKRLVFWDGALSPSQTAKYINGIKYPIQEHVILNDVFFMDEAHNKTMKIERLQSRAPPFRHPLSIEEPLGDEVVQPSSTKVDQPLA